MNGVPRFRGPRLRDPRMLIALVLVAASVAATWLVVTKVANTISVWAAAEPLAPGAVIGESSLRAVEVRLPADGAGYVTADRSDIVGQTVLSPIAAGELVPASQLGSAEALGGRRVLLPLQAVPGDIQPGTRVDVWATDLSRDRGEPVEIVTHAVVLGVRRDSGAFVGNRSSTIEVFVPTRSLKAVLTALAAEDYISVVTVPKDSP